MSERFQLHTKYKPTGDQPTAISSLVRGLDTGVREQTLLGVTGSGKSVVGNTPVLIRRSESIEKLEIGPLIDQLFKKYHTGIQVSGDSEYIDNVDISESDKFETWSFDPKTGKNSWKSVVQISRHSMNKVLNIRTTCGRSVSTTFDHNLYVLRDGELKLVSGDDLQIGDFVPTTRALPAPDKQFAAVKVFDVLSNLDGLYVKLRPNMKIQQLEKLDATHRKKWGIVNKSEQLKVSEYIGWNDGAKYGEKIGMNKRTAHIPIEIPLTTEFLRFIGYYIAEGHAEKRYITITTADKEVENNVSSAVEQVGLALKKRIKPYDYQVGSTVFARLMHDMCGNISRNKKLPDFWTKLSNKQLAEILAAYFSGDGGIDGGYISASTLSDKLASDLQYALLRFGINARRRKKRVTLPNGTVRIHNAIYIYGQSNLQKFAKEVGFYLERKQDKLLKLVSENKSENTNVDLIPINGQEVLELRRNIGWSQKDLADKIGVDRSFISMLESNNRKMSYTVVRRLIKSVDELGDPKAKLFLENASALVENYWTPIKSISERDGKQKVYDFSVEENETFLAGDGGIFVHNTFTMANIIAQQQKPTLVLAHNKTLAAQLYSEFRQFFPDNEVHYFVSYFDYYQPEAYIASSDVYIEKDSKINDEIDRLRHAATSALLTRKDVIIVASVSCIYGIGSPSNYSEMSVTLEKGKKYNQAKLIRHLNDIQYKRNDMDFRRGTFRVRGDTIDVFPSGSEMAVRIELFGDDIERIMEINPLTGEVLGEKNFIKFFPTSHYVTPEEKIKNAIENIKNEYDERLKFFEENGKYLEAQRLSQRVKFDLEMLEQTGFVKGIENYSRYLTERAPGEQPATLLDYFPDDFLLFVDESHMTLPQVRGMYNGDRARKETLVEYGFRLPSALDNRPLTFDEFEKHINQVVYVSATPGDYELSRSGEPVEQVIRPTGLLDPKVEVRPSEHQVDDLMNEIQARVAKNQRVLVTTLTKRMAEDLSEYLKENGVKTAYIHSDVDTLERGDILKDLRMGVYDVLVGINLLREGLDLPEVSLVAIIDADKEGFLRSEQALTQTIGRAARHLDGTVIMYADNMTGSMKRAISETNRRRKIQDDYNKKHDITPASIAKAVDEGLRALIPKEEKPKLDFKKIPKEEYKPLIDDLTGQMELAAANLQFEKAAELRDLIEEIKAKL